MTAPSQIRQTHTLVELDLPPEVYDYITKRLRDAGYDHLFLQEGADTIIDMSGIGIVPDKDATPQHPIRQRITAEFLQRTGKYVTNDATREAAIAEAIEKDRATRLQRAPLSLDYIERHIGADEGDRDAVVALVRETEAAHGITARAAEPEGLPVAQEPKYTVNGTHIVNRASGEAIPHDEPVFIFRARDKWAAGVLGDYAQFVNDPKHAEAVNARFIQFGKWAEAHPDRMKEPDTAASPTPPADARAAEPEAPTYTTAFPGLSAKEVEDLWQELFKGKYQLRVDYQLFASRLIEKAFTKAGVRLAHPSTERLQKIWQDLGGAEGFLKTFGFLQYARAVEKEIWGEQE